MFQEIEDIEGNRLLNASVADLCDYFEKEYTVDPIQLNTEQITVDQEEAQIDVSRDFLRDVRDRTRPAYIKGTSISYFVPFEGDPELFKCQPSSFTLNPPQATIDGNDVVLTYPRLDHDKAAIEADFRRDLSEIERYLNWINAGVQAFNEGIKDKARVRIEARREKLLKDQGLAAALGFPLRRRENVSKTYVLPVARKKVKPMMPAASEKPFSPEPVLDLKQYDHVLSVISNMVTVMERSPKAFSGMKEEDLRQHFLVQLNGQYEGQATGETFNFDGKTDILIREKGKNVFIAECKFWRGSKAFSESIDQLLDYTSWHDSKTALLVFNRNKDFSAVVSKIPDVIKAHSNFKRELEYESDTGFRFILHHRDDVNRELILTVLSFEVPE
ncbi:MAG: hypothetical protein M1539_03255 [Actinobacteria bacterium]|nr:hypothetical protein [Actinomycetota bacterium]